MRQVIVGLVLFSSPIFAQDSIADKAVKIDAQLERKGVAILCAPRPRGSFALNVEEQADSINSIVSNLKSTVDMSAPSIQSSGSYLIPNVCVTLTKK